jgi:hypothetical protein
VTALLVIPAKAGTPARLRTGADAAPFLPEVPAFAGMTARS